jgi:glycogen debranching enzyme
MDFSKNIVLKENYTFLVGDSNGQITGDEKGLYSYDTRFLQRYCWRYGGCFQQLLLHVPDAEHFCSHHARMQGEVQTIGVYRRFRVVSEGFKDDLSIENTSNEVQNFSLQLETEPDFSDLFSIRGLHSHHPTSAKRREKTSGLSYEYRAADGLVFSLNIRLDPVPQRIEGGTLFFEFNLNPGEKRKIHCRVRVEHPFSVTAPVLNYSEWRREFASLYDTSSGDVKNLAVLKTAVDDVRALVLFTEHGIVPAAGIPWYVALFGRDSIITAYMLLPRMPKMAVGVLRYLAAYQGSEVNCFRGEAPGKILHEIRFGELSRTGVYPHSPYYGSSDATPLYIVLLHELWRTGGATELIVELKSTWEAALHWIQDYGDSDGDGFVEFEAASDGKGLHIQSWKDSEDSMSHADGSLAKGPIAPSEVQGYVYAAYNGAADFYEFMGEGQAAEYWRDAAVELRQRFHEHFWLEDLKIFAAALDGEKRPLRVLNSNAGQLLFTGIVPEAVLPALVRTLFSSSLWSGWGIRTLGTQEKRYNPVSYHNGSVWPHDTALIAGGLQRCGYHSEAGLLKKALFDLANSRPDKRLPELIAGYSRIKDEPPVEYPVACSPQAWDSATLLYLFELVH